MLNANSCSSREELLSLINLVSFAVDEIILYLDTHPYDQDALRYYKENMAYRKEFLTRYTEEYGPLTLDHYSNPDQKWLWETQPFPWETEGGCR